MNDIHVHPCSSVVPNAPACQLCHDTGWRPSPSGIGVFTCNHGARSTKHEARASFESTATLGSYLATGRSRAGLEFTPDQLSFLRVTQHALGQANALTIEEICRRLAWAFNENNKRSVKGIVEELVVLQGLKVGASRGHKRKWAEGRYETVACGYYWCQTDEEVLASIGPLYAQALSELRRVWSMLGGSAGLHRRLAQEFGQLPLFGETDERN